MHWGRQLACASSTSTLPATSRWGDEFLPLRTFVVWRLAQRSCILSYNRSSELAFGDLETEAIVGRVTGSQHVEDLPPHSREARRQRTRLALEEPKPVTEWPTQPAKVPSLVEQVLESGCLPGPGYDRVLFLLECAETVAPAEGWVEVRAVRRRRERLLADGRILGTGEFVEQMLRAGMRAPRLPWILFNPPRPSSGYPEDEERDSPAGLPPSK